MGCKAAALAYHLVVSCLGLLHLFIIKHTILVCIPVAHALLLSASARLASIIVNSDLGVAMAASLALKKGVPDLWQGARAFSAGQNTSSLDMHSLD